MATLRNIECENQCKSDFGFFNPKRQICIGECVKQFVSSDNGNGNDNGKKITQEPTINLFQEQEEYAYTQEIAAPFTYAPVIMKTYSPVFQTHSPYATATASPITEATSKIDLLLSQLAKTAQSQKAKQEASQDLAATISDEEKTGLGALLILGIVGVVGYYGIKEISKKKSQLKTEIKGVSTR